MIEKYDGYRLDHPCFRHVYEITYKEMKVTDCWVSDKDEVLLRVDKEYVPVFYHCGKSTEKSGDLGLLYGANAFYEWKDGNGQKAIVGHVKGKPAFIVGFADYEPRFCCTEPIFKKPETWEPKDLYDNAGPDHKASATGVAGFKKVDGMMQYFAELKANTKGPLPVQCGGPGVGIKGYAIAEPRDALRVQVREFGERFGIPYRGDCSVVFNYDFNCDKIIEETAIWIIAQAGKRYKRIRIAGDPLKIDVDCPTNQIVELPLDIGSNELLDWVEFEVLVGSRIRSDQEPTCSGAGRHYVNAYLKYMCIKPSKTTIDNMS